MRAERGPPTCLRGRERAAMIFPSPMALAGDSVERYLISARLKPGRAAAAERTLLAGPPFDPAEAGLSAHAAYLTDDSVYLVFEGQAAHVKAMRLAREHVVEVSSWQSSIQRLAQEGCGFPAGARCVYRWPPEVAPLPLDHRRSQAGALRQAEGPPAPGQATPVGNALGRKPRTCPQNLAPTESIVVADDGNTRASLWSSLVRRVTWIALQPLRSCSSADIRPGQRGTAQACLPARLEWQGRRGVGEVGGQMPGDDLLC